MDIALAVLDLGFKLKAKFEQSDDNVGGWSRLKPRVDQIVQLIEQHGAGKSGSKAWIEQHLQHFTTLRSDLEYMISKLNKWEAR